MKSHFETLAEITKPSFTFDIWYRRMIGGEPEKDFEIDTFEAETLEEAVDMAIKKYPYNEFIFHGSAKVAHAHLNELTGKIV